MAQGNAVFSKAKAVAGNAGRRGEPHVWTTQLLESAPFLSWSHTFCAFTHGEWVHQGCNQEFFRGGSPGFCVELGGGGACTKDTKHQ